MAAETCESPNVYVRHIALSEIGDYVNDDQWVTFFCPSEKCAGRPKRSILGRVGAIRGTPFQGKCARCNTISAFIIE